MRGVRLVLCANAASGGGSPAPPDLAAALRERGAAVDLRDIGDLGPPDRWPDDGALAAGADRLVVAGGDGSIGLAAAIAAHAGVRLAVVPTGTANDFARALGLPGDLGEACALAADPAAATRPLDLGDAGGRPFVNAASAGLAPVAAEAARPFKPVLGPLAYAIGALRAGATARPLDVRVEVDGAAAFAGRSWQVVVGNTGAFGGGSSTGAADPADGALDVAIVPAGPRVALVRRAYAMRAGRLAHQDDVVHARGAEVTVHGEGVRFNVDGEVCGCGRPARFAVRPSAVEVVVPS
jgi:YegS/Rv2252/BmrU family lipid kinase